MDYLVSFLDSVSARAGSAMMCADLELKMVIIVAVLVFAGAFLDSIAGGGGLITLPAYLMTGLPAHIALGTNKLSSCIGSGVSVIRFIKNGYVKWRLAIPSAILAIIGAHFGTRLQLTVPDSYLKYILLFVLPAVAVVIMKRRSFDEKAGDIDPWLQMAVSCAAALVIGTYDGFYGPGTGTFLLLIYCRFARLDVRTANGNAKVANLSSNLSAMVTSFVNGKTFLALGLIGAVASCAGNYIGSGLAIQNGSKIVKPAVIAVLVLLTVKIISEL